MHFERQKKNKLKKYMCAYPLPKIFRPVTRNTLIFLFGLTILTWERSGSVIECLTQDRGAAGLSLTGVTALWSLSKTHSS